MSAKIKKTDATAVKAKTAKAITSMKQLDEALAAPEIVTTATKKAEAKVAKVAKPPKARKTPVEDLVVFAFRLTAAERDAIHKAAGPANASKFMCTRTCASFATLATRAERRFAAGSSAVTVGSRIPSIEYFYSIR